jgi:hypothetical protein
MVGMLSKDLTEAVSDIRRDMVGGGGVVVA